jgi:hypothetical protein
MKHYNSFMKLYNYFMKHYNSVMKLYNYFMKHYNSIMKYNVLQFHYETLQLLYEKEL